uniref:Uncharacterized protein n=1 Tax=Strigamia maritima TaxID=126957 RepID=T1JEC0_STRMM
MATRPSYPMPGPGNQPPPQQRFPAPGPPMRHYNQSGYPMQQRPGYPAMNVVAGRMPLVQGQGAPGMGLPYQGRLPQIPTNVMSVDQARKRPMDARQLPPK